MGRNDVAVVIKQRGTRHGVSPVGTIPGVDLHALGVAVEVNLIGGPHCEFVRDFGRAIVVACLRCECCGGAEQRGRDLTPPP